MMTSSSSNLPETNPSQPENQDLAAIAAEFTDLGLAAATIPMLLATAGIRAVENFANELGELSEEAFRGDRLPILEVPQSSQPE
ncbi:hypothetical protein [Geitlerinema sp. PCC 9228]|jgi:protein tyrosine phosphatase (PTP) superfamily phosphohydrolase (DUF442 family)|uniref:hypothetical protein n=1 Tax=Geitlerinema sp. PCC 9228 TaxID=111611 RepID=UPI00147DC514|nr:hypothetical protein [Geitlerinema sp. PCC 9228]